MESSVVGCERFVFDRWQVIDCEVAESRLRERLPFEGTLMLKGWDVDPNHKSPEEATLREVFFRYRYWPPSATNGGGRS